MHRDFCPNESQSPLIDKIRKIRKNMKLKINDFGAIDQGTIDLSKRINLLCGPNGTGKTYFSYLIYGLLKNKLHVRGYEDVAIRLFNDRQVVMEIELEDVQHYRDEMLKDTKADMDILFGISADTKDRIFKNCDISFDESIEDFKDRIFTSSIKAILEINNMNVELEKASNSMSITLRIVDENIPSDMMQMFSYVLYSSILYTLAIYPISRVQVFPVERNSIYTFSKELSIRKQEAIDSIQLLADREKKINRLDLFFNTMNSRRYPLPIRDGLLIAEDLAEIKKQKSVFFNFAEEMENELLHGKVQISNDGEIQFVPEKARRTALPIQMSASIVKTLSSLIVYLKHIANANDLIIIDEPEINLHPSNQVLLARILARLANRGFRLLVSTHSDYIIREFNNLIMLSNRNNETIQKIREENGYNSEEYINLSDINVHSFKYKGKTSKKVSVSPVKIDKFGFSIEVIDNVIERMNEVADKLYYATKYGN